MLLFRLCIARPRPAPAIFPKGENAGAPQGPPASRREAPGRALPRRTSQRLWQTRSLEVPSRLRFS